MMKSRKSNTETHQTAVTRISILFLISYSKMLIFKNYSTTWMENITTVCKRSLRRLCFHRCLSVHRGSLCPGESLSKGVSVLGFSVQEGLCQEGSLSRESLSGGLCPWGSQSRGVSVRETLPTVRLRAGGTHPNGMHSCEKCFSIQFRVINKRSKKSCLLIILLSVNNYWTSFNVFNGHMEFCRVVTDIYKKKFYSVIILTTR